MTPKQILDSFSETLMRDERILSAPERALLSAIVQHAKNASASRHQTQEEVRSVIASAVGEVVAQRAFTVLGASIVERILETNSAPLAELTNPRTADVLAGPKDPETPSNSPGPGVKDTPLPRDPQTPSGPLRAPSVPSSSPDPETPSQVATTVVSRASAAVAERAQVLPAQCVVLDEFLAPQELAELTSFALEREAEFRNSEVISPTTEGGMVNYDHRRSCVMMDLGRHQDVIVERIQKVLPQVLEKLGMAEFTIAGVEAQITSSNDGDFFHFHSDNASERVACRYLTFVYFFHQEPRMFEGGELRIHDARLEEGVYVSEGSYQTIVPQQNQIVLFPCQLMHEITPVKCASQRFADSRFTLNGWLRR